MRIVLSFVLWFNFFGSAFAQNNLQTPKEIDKLTKQATKLRESGNFEKSLLISRLALRKSIAIRDNVLIAKNYNNVAANYNDLAEFDKAIFYYNKALIYANFTQNDSVKQRINNNLGNMYCFEKKKYEKGVDYYRKALEYSEKISDSSQMAFTNLNIAWAFFDIDKFEEGKGSLEMINSYYKKHNNDFIIVALNMLNGMYSNYKNEDTKAKFYFVEAIRLGKKLDEKSDLSFSHLEYSKFLLKRKDFKKAYENLELYTKLNDEIYAEEKLEKANVEGINLELDEYKREVDKIENEKELQSQSLKKSRIIGVLFIIVLLVLLMLLYSLYKNYRFKKKSNRELTIANEELFSAKEKAEEASLMKTQFVSTMSHELRTPLYGVIGITDILLDEHKELANSPHLSSLKFSARYLLSLVNDILQINKIEESKITLESLTFNVLDEIVMVKNSLSFIAQNYNNKITIKIDPTIPEYLIGDKLRFSQIIMNLVSNALKFTKNGEVIITADLVKVENKSHYIEFQIEDNGIGIAAIDQDKIFEKFVQVGRNENDYQGTGLGLAIVKRLLTLFKSDILLESKVGVGTKFKFTIAFDYDPNLTNEIINDINVDLNSNQIFRILVVEDNKINQIVTKKIIEKYNCTCVMVDDGLQAIEMLSKENFDVVLMDINMPLINGFETTRKIRQKGIKTPIIALTAYTKDEITEEAISVGMNDIMVKPFEPLKLFKVISEQVNKVKNAG